MPSHQGAERHSDVVVHLGDLAGGLVEVVQRLHGCCWPVPEAFLARSAIVTFVQ